MDAIAVKTSQDALLTGVGLFLPTDADTNANEVEFTLEIFKGHSKTKIHSQTAVNDLYMTDCEYVGELRLSVAVPLESSITHWLVLTTRGAAITWTGQGGSYIHCVDTVCGGMLVLFETPDDELEEFLGFFENDTTTHRGQFPRLYLNVNVTPALDKTTD